MLKFEKKGGVDSLRQPSPLEVATAYAQSGVDLLFFDTSGHLPKFHHQPLSVIAAKPVEVLHGHLSETRDLQEVLLAGKRDSHASSYPSGGLAGWVDYEGNYTFGVFPQFFVYSHRTSEWLASPPPQWPKGRCSEVPQLSDWTAEMSQSQFEGAVRRAQSEIAKGNIYQVNLAQRFSANMKNAPHCFGLYESLRQASPAPMSGYARFAQREVMSSSPELFLKMSGRGIETRPIKGTRPRYHEPWSDKSSAAQLMSSEKERAELIMITDLLRNDLGQVCEFGSVGVEQLLSLERLEHVFHLVSTVKGRLRGGVTHLQALQACYPGGSITGAPKQAARRVIAREEPCQRGLYTGVMGYLGFNGESQFNLLIRSLIRESESLHYHVGAGIVADSDPASEYHETMLKAEGMRKALQQIGKVWKV